MSFFKQNTTDMTAGNPVRLIMTFAVPLFVGNVFQMFYNTVDTLVVGRFVGPGALAAVGGSGVSYNVMLTLINGFTSGAAVVIAQAFGAGDREGVRKGYTTSCIIIALTGILFTLLGESLAGPLLRLLNTPGDVIADSLTYLYIMYGGILAACLYNGLAAFLRAVGDSTTPLVGLIISSGLNIILDLVFVLYFGLGIAGVAAATVISQAVSGFYCLVQMHRHNPEFSIHRGSFIIDPAAAGEMIRIGVPTAFSTASVTISVMLLQRAINSYGSTVMAAYTTEEKVAQIFYCLSFSFGLAVGVFVGQNKGARQYDRVQEGLYAGIRVSLLYHVTMAAIMLIFARPLAGFFTTDGNVQMIAVEILRITAWFAPVLGLVFVFQHFLRNVSFVTPTIWMSGAEILSRGLFPVLLGSFYGYRGIWWATPIGWILSLIIGILAWRSGKWEKT